MKSQKNSAYLYFSLATVIALGNAMPTLGAVESFRQMGNDVMRSPSSQQELLLARWNFSSRYGAAPRRRTRGFRRGGCLAPGQQAIAILPQEEALMENPPTPVIIEETNPNHNSLNQNLKQEVENSTPPEEVKTEVIEMPSTQQETDRVWFTADPYPKVYFYLPQNWAQKGEFVLYNQQNEVVYSATITLPGNATEEAPRQAGVIEVNLSNKANDIQELEAGNTYLWEVQVLCDEINRSGNPTINGWIQRLEDDSAESLKADLEGVSDPSQINQIYAERGIWYNLVAQIYANSNQDDWNALLKEVGSDNLTDAPMLGSASIDETYEHDFPPL
jgi:hypothetical protein